MDIEVKIPREEFAKQILSQFSNKLLGVKTPTIDDIVLKAIDKTNKEIEVNEIKAIIKVERC